jgi:mono/diheme cytochrome c family protein
MTPVVAVSAEYGKYLLEISGCRDCHGQDLDGGPFPDPTIEKTVPNLTPGGELAFWSGQDFIAALRTGATPDGRSFDPKLMPWKTYRNLTDDELGAIWLYLQGLPGLQQRTRKD